MRPIRAVLVLLALVTLTGCGTGPATADRADPPAPPPASPVPPVSPVSAAPAAPAAPRGIPQAAVAVPPGLIAGIAVFDRRTGAFTVRHNVDQRFRSASLVKLLIAIDHLWDRESVPDADRRRLDVMLSRSDDAAASHFYDRGGRAAVIARMNQRLGLAVVAPTAPRTGWGSTEVSAAHLVRIYRYLLDEAPARIGGYVLGRLRQGTFTRCGTDRYDQSFGVPTAFAGRPWAAKQGWYEFRTAPRTCTTGDSLAALPVGAPAAVPVAVPAAGPVDWAGEALHTTGVVGPDDRTVVVVLTTHPRGTPYAAATAAVTRLTGSLPVAGAG